MRLFSRRRPPEPVPPGVCDMCSGTGALNKDMVPVNRDDPAMDGWCVWCAGSGWAPPHSLKRIGPARRLDDSE